MRRVKEVSSDMRRLASRLTVATLLATVALMLAASPAFAPEDCNVDCNPIKEPTARAASLEGLGEAAERSSFSWGITNKTNPGTTTVGDVILTTQDPTTPGVTPGGGGGGIEP